MPWTSPEFEKLVEKAKNRLRKELPVEYKATIYLTNNEEMTQRVKEELKEDGFTKEEIKELEITSFPGIIGKYFKKEDEILVLTGIGENEDTIMHEFIHSIQKCEPNREGIADYLTYKITGNTKYIDPYDLNDWNDIERANGLKKIKERLFKEGDCEEF